MHGARAGGGGGNAAAVNDAEPAEQHRSVQEQLKVNVCPNPVQYAPFHPSPYESTMDSVQLLSTAAWWLPVNGAPPERVLPSLQLSVQLTS